jgi:hypothetical protein
MTSYKHFILPAALVGSTAVASAFATFMAIRLRHTRQNRQKAAPAEWEDGSVATPDTSMPSP